VAVAVVESVIVLVFIEVLIVVLFGPVSVFP
jgi:hypothetical protein